MCCTNQTIVWLHLSAVIVFQVAHTAFFCMFSELTSLYGMLTFSTTLKLLNDWLARITSPPDPLSQNICSFLLAPNSWNEPRNRSSLWAAARCKASIPEDYLSYKNPDEHQMAQIIIITPILLLPSSDQWVSAVYESLLPHVLVPPIFSCHWLSLLPSRGQ